MESSKRYLGLVGREQILGALLLRRRTICIFRVRPSAKDLCADVGTRS
jgi:hypothetical protein